MMTGRSGISVIGVLVGFLLAWGCGGGGPGPSSPAPGGATPTGGAALGEPPPLVAEPAQAPDRSSPEILLRSLLEGRGRQDLPFLARCEAVTAGKPRLDRLDEARVWRHYCMRSVQPLWDKIEAALEDGAASFAIDGDGATGTFEVGGSIGRIEMHFVRSAGDWYVEYPEE